MVYCVCCTRDGIGRDSVEWNVKRVSRRIGGVETDATVTESTQVAQLKEEIRRRGLNMHGCTEKQVRLPIRRIGVVPCDCHVMANVLAITGAGGSPRRSTGSGN